MNKIKNVSVFIITGENEYVEYSEYARDADGGGVFLYMTNDELDQDYHADNSICVHRDWRRIVTDASSHVTYVEIEERDTVIPFIKIDEDGYICANWQDDFVKIPDNSDFTCGDRGDYFTRETITSRFLDGYKSCKNIISNAASIRGSKTPEQYIPAMMLAYHSTVFFNGKTCHGYLPAIGQWIYLTQNIDVFNSAMKALGGDIIPIDMPGLRGDWFSSTEFGYSNILLMSDVLRIHSKLNPERVLPFFIP